MTNSAGLIPRPKTKDKDKRIIQNLYGKLYPFAKMISSLCSSRNKTIIPRLLEAHNKVRRQNQDEYSIDMSTAENEFMKQKLLEACYGRINSNLVKEVCHLYLAYEQQPLIIS
jgi:hypothetical protein